MASTSSARRSTSASPIESPVASRLGAGLTALRAAAQFELRQADIEHLDQSIDVLGRERERRADLEHVGVWPGQSNEDPVVAELRCEASAVVVRDWCARAPISNEVEATAREIAERDEHMRHVESQMLDINEVYRDLNSLIIDQGDALNSIEANMDTVTAAVAKGTQEVVTANAYHKKWSFGWW